MTGREETFYGHAPNVASAARGQNPHFRLLSSGQGLADRMVHYGPPAIRRPQVSKF